MKALDVKLARDLWRMRGQVAAIALVLASAAATFVLSMGVHRSLIETRDAYYDRASFADVFAEMTRAPRGIVTQVAAIAGVRRAEGSIQQYATLELPDRVEPVRLLVNSVNERGRTHLNRLTLSRGRFPRAEAPEEAVIDEVFAKANNLGIGDRVYALIHGRRQSLHIVGAGLAPNFIYAMAPGDLIPDDRRFGIMWMGEKALEAATERREAINTLSLTLEPGASQPDVIRKVDALLGRYGGTGAYGRKDHLSNAFLENELLQLEAMTRVIPPIFLFVSIFLVYIVLARMIRIERSQIGLAKAFGYSSWSIGWHYMKFALCVAVVATILGSLAGVWMGQGMTRLYARYYRFPFLYFEISPGVFLIAACLSTGSAALAALGGIRNTMGLAPAEAMTPPAPPVYRRGAVETLGRIAGFTVIGHMIARHIARWPWRSAFTVFGVALSMGLLFATIQFVDSSRSMIDTYFYRAQRQDLTVTFNESQNRDVLHALAQLPGVLRVEPMRSIPVKLSNGNRLERAAIESSPIGSLLMIKIDSKGQEVALPATGLLLSQQMADKLSVAPGDTVLVEMLGGRRSMESLPVAAVIDEFVGKRVYAADTTIDAFARDATPVGSALLRIDTSRRDEIMGALKQMPVVLGVSEREASLKKFEEMIDDNIFTMLGFYIAFASAIAVGVVYNSARILFSERAHELATLRVLGFHRSEVAAVLLGELAVLIAIAIPVGSVVGYALALLMTEMFSSDLFRLPLAPSAKSYGYSAVVVITAAALTAVIVARRILALDMVRVLKGRE